MTNWIQDTNKFLLPAPPQWWLIRLRDFDSQLVVFPSRLRRAYILARRRNQTLRRPKLVKLDGDLLKQTAGDDGQVLAQNDLVFVDQIIGWGGFTTKIFSQLRARDTWRVGGGDKYADLLETQEAHAATQKRKSWLDDIEHRAGDAYRSYQARTGQRNQHANTRGGAAPKARIIHSGVL